MSERHMSHVSYLPSKIALTTAATSMRGRMGGSVVTGGSIAVPPLMVVMPVLTPVVTVCCRREGAQSRPGSSGEQELREIRDTATNTCGHTNSQ